MTFFSPEFLVCFITFFVIYWACARSVLAQKWLIFLGSYAFICANSLHFGAILFIYTCFVFLCGKWLIYRAEILQNLNFDLETLLKEQEHKKRKKSFNIEQSEEILALKNSINITKSSNNFLLLSIIFLCVLFLCFFKYYDYISIYFINLAQFFGLKMIESIAFPLGISYYTFMSIIYLVALSKAGCKKYASFLNLACFLAFFPSIVMGPISRAGYNEKGLKPLLPQFNKRKKFKNADEIFTLIIFACVKLLLISGLLAPFVNDAFVGVWSDEYSSAQIITAILLYGVVLYGNFSGFIDLARALALALGFELAQNFKMPYAKRNIREFWQSWHITLTTFIMRYIYIPLGGSKYGFFRTQINVMIAFILSGLWHGVGLNFLLWGAIHGLGLVIFNFYKTFINVSFNYYFSLLLTYIYVSISWVFFANDFDGAIAVFSAFARLEAYHNYSEIVIILLILLGVAFYHKCAGLFEWIVEVLTHTAFVPKVLILGLIFTLIIALMPSGIPNFIYASF